MLTLLKLGKELFGEEAHILQTLKYIVYFMYMSNPADFNETASVGKSYACA